MTASGGGVGGIDLDAMMGVAATGESGGGIADRPPTSFATYEDYLDSQVSPMDLYYLEDEELARQLVELGHTGYGDTLKREEFEARKKAEREKHLHREAAPKPLASMGKDLSDKPLLQALASREELIRNGKLTTILFIRDRNPRGQEISGYIDLATRLRQEPFEPYFEGRRKLLPRPSDLSYYNWETQASSSTSSANFQVIADDEAGLLFKNKRDRKVINVDPSVPPGDNSSRLELSDPNYIQVVLIDHMTRRRA